MRKPASIFPRVCETIADEIQDLPDKNDRPRRRLGGSGEEMLRTSVRKLVRESVAAAAQGSVEMASVNKRSGAYSHGKLGQKLSYRITVERAYEGMIRLGYLVEVQKGVSEGSAGKYLTRYMATERLLQMFADVDLVELPVILPPDVDAPLIRIKIKRKEKRPDGGKPRVVEERLPVPDFEEVVRMRANLERINRLLLRNWIDLEMEDHEFEEMRRGMASKKLKDSEDRRSVDLSSRLLYRVFNDRELRRGGRFYGGWWQHIPKRYRSRLLITGKRTREYDYSGYHPMMLYAERGLVPPDDPYEGIVKPNSSTNEDRKAARDAAKRAFNAMLNASKPMEGQPGGLKLSEFGTNWAEVSDRILRRHAAISDTFYSDSGARLQRIDSDIAEQIMLHFADMRTVVLPVHDSFIVHQDYEAELQRVMDKLFEERFSIPPRMELERQWPVPRDEKEYSSEDDIDIMENLPGFIRRELAFHSLRER